MYRITYGNQRALDKRLGILSHSTQRKTLREFTHIYRVNLRYTGQQGVAVLSAIVHYKRAKGGVKVYPMVGREVMQCHRGV